VQANSKIETGRQTSSLLGDSVVGVLVQFAGFSAAFFINSVTFLLSAVSVCLIRWNADVSAENTRETPNDEQTVFQRVWMGFSYIVSNKIVLILTVSGALYNFSTTMLFAMYAYHASNNLKLDGLKSEVQHPASGKVHRCKPARHTDSSSLRSA
jgi:hypothetical protein